MAKLYNMAQMTVSGAPGTGTITLNAAAVAAGITYLTFASAGIANGDVVSYRITDGTAWEVGRGTYTTSGTTLTRGMLKSSTGSTLTLTSAAIVSIVALAEDAGGGAQAVSWLAGVNPNNAVVLIATRAMVITGIRGVPMVAAGGTATVVVKTSAGGAAVHSGSFDANGTASTVQTLTLTTTTLAAGDFLYLSTTGTAWTASVGNITVFVS
jgi:hypothetical protein